MCVRHQERCADPRAAVSPLTCTAVPRGTGGHTCAGRSAVRESQQHIWAQHSCSTGLRTPTRARRARLAAGLTRGASHRASQARDRAAAPRAGGRRGPRRPEKASRPSAPRRREQRGPAGRWAGGFPTPPTPLRQCLTRGGGAGDDEAGGLAEPVRHGAARRRRGRASPHAAAHAQCGDNRSGARAQRRPLGRARGGA